VPGAYRGGPGEAAFAGVPPPPPHLESAAAILVDIDTGRILLAKRAHDRHPAGELSKIVAALVLVEQGDLDGAARISREAANASGWGMSVAEGDLVPLADLLTIMMHRPGPAAALAVAEHVAGSAAAFARHMNAYGIRAGAGSSHFAGPDDAGNRSTAYDLARIALAALDHPAFVDAVSRTRSALGWNGRSVINVNSLLLLEPGAYGIKTSFTPESGYSLALAVSREGRRLLVVLLGSPEARSRRLDAQSLINYGIANFAALSASPAVELDRYVVREGDTLTELAERFDVPISAIRLLNGIGDPESLRAGDTLWIPR